MRAARLLLVAVLGCGGGDAAPPDARIDAPMADAAADAAGTDAAYACPVLSASGSVNLPKNIILVLGDGMGPRQIDAGRISKGSALAFEGLASPVLLNTDGLDWDLDGDVTDSAAAATAIATGQRVRNSFIHLISNNPIETIAEIAQAQGKAIGLVTTSATYDASPAAFGAHIRNRDMQSAIATQLVSTFKPEVMLGGGVDVFEADGNALLTLAGNEGYHIVRNATELTAWVPGTNPMILGVFESSVVAPSPFESLFAYYMTPFTRRTGSSTDPLLPAMVDRALERLATDADGFFLFVENESTDTIAHNAIVELPNAQDGIPVEVVQLDDAVANIIAWVEANSSWTETLLLVGADHETAGYDFIGTDIANATFAATPNHTRVHVAWYIKGAGASDLSSLCGLPDLFLLMSGQLP